MRRSRVWRQDCLETWSGEGAWSLDLTGKGDFPSLCHYFYHDVGDDFGSAEWDHLLPPLLSLHTSQPAGGHPTLAYSHPAMSLLGCASPHFAALPGQETAQVPSSLLTKEKNLTVLFLWRSFPPCSTARGSRDCCAVWVDTSGEVWGPGECCQVVSI